MKNKKKYFEKKKKKKSRNFAKFTEKHLCQSLFSCNFIKRRPWHRYVTVNFAKFLITQFLQNTAGRLLLQVFPGELKTQFLSERNIFLKQSLYLIYTLIQYTLFIIYTFLYIFTSFYRVEVSTIKRGKIFQWNLCFTFPNLYSRTKLSCNFKKPFCTKRT